MFIHDLKLLLSPPPRILINKQINNDEETPATVILFEDVRPRLFSSQVFVDKARVIVGAFHGRCGLDANCPEIRCVDMHSVLANM